MRASPSPTKTRELVIQALYQKNISGDSNTKVLKELRQTQKGLNTEKVSEIVKDIKSLEQKFIDTISKFSNIVTMPLISSKNLMISVVLSFVIS